MWTCQPCIEPLHQLATVAKRRKSVMFDSDENRRADKNLAPRITLAFGVAHARGKALTFGAKSH